MSNEPSFLTQKYSSSRFIYTTILMLLAAATTINAPSIFQGYGTVIVAMTVAILLLPPLYAALSVLLGFILAMPIVLYAKTMFVIVAVISILLRPIVAYIASWSRTRINPIASSVLLASLDALIATTVAILYYGDDGIHVSLSVFNIITALLTYYTLKAYEQDKTSGIIATIGLILFIFGTAFYYSHAAILGILTILLLGNRQYKLSPNTMKILGTVLIVLGIIIGYAGLLLNASVLLYPFKPSSYTKERWSISGEPCGTLQNVFENTYDPMRLRIVKGCIVAEGTISGIPELYEDGDITFNLNVTSINQDPWASLGTHILRKGYLHIEIVESDHEKILGKYNMTLCEGDRVKVWGPLIVDTDHGQWSEIHPVIGLEIIERGEGPCITFSK